MLTHATYDRFPYIRVSDSEEDCAQGWQEIHERLSSDAAVRAARCVVVECYPGTDKRSIAEELTRALQPELCVRSEDALLSAQQLLEKFDLGNDPVFTMMAQTGLEEFFDADKLQSLKRAVESCPGRTLVVGAGASIVAPDAEVFIYADLSRWEIQRRQRLHEVGNLGLENREAAASQLYKRSFFLDWRAADRTKAKLLPTLNYLLDTSNSGEPKLISGEALRAALRSATTQPFRVVPFFDPGPWGGQWMGRQFGLPDNGSNYAWCFDCVPEENSLLLAFGERRVEIPALDLVLFQPAELLGSFVHDNFGAEFPIRFDYLDTVQGGNLSLQVHPLRSYIREHFGMDYTQDESYYMFEAEPDATIYLGFKEGIDPQQFELELRQAQLDSSLPFPTEKYVNIWPAKRHDHFLIPAGTVHCSGRNGVVLEISATPYIFTFKLWDWGRLGLDGKPRPVHLDHGIANIQFNRNTAWVKSHLINRVEVIGEGPFWKEERTGLHELEFIETRRHWFTGPTPHNTFGTVNVLNLVEGREVIVDSPRAAFAPFHVHYGETFIVPAAIGEYTIRPVEEGAQCATMKAFVKDGYDF